MPNALKSKKSFVAVVAGLAVASVMSACGNGNNATGDGSAAPFTIITWGSFTGVSAYPEIVSGAKAAAAAINAAGGVAGRKIEVMTCDTELDPNKQLDCARQAVSQRVSAVVGSSTNVQAAAVFTLLEASHIGYIGGNGLTPAEFQSPIAFSLPGQPGWTYGVVSGLVSAGVTKPAIITCDTAACHVGEQLFTAAFAKKKVPVVRSVIAPLATTDYSAIAANAIRGGVDGIAVTGSPNQLIGLVTALRSQGFTGPIGLPDVVLPPNYTILGSKANGLIVAYLLEPPTEATNPGIAKFIHQMKQYDPTAKLSAQALQAWWGVQVFADIAAKSKSTDGADVLAVAKALKPGELAPPIGPKLPVGGTPGLKGYARLSFDQEVSIATFKNGLPVIGPFFNPFTS
jgi:ABC-type branched-subunit amino acid transport system substrate-binding protein